MRESHSTSKELISQIQELQERMKVPRSQSGGSRSKSLSCVEPRPIGTCLTQGNVLVNSRAVIESSQTLNQGIPHFVSQSATGGNSMRDSTGDRYLEVKSDIKRPFQPRDLQGDQP